MPIIPKFNIVQDDNFVYVHINVPYVRVSSAEMVCDGRDFSFFCKPYLLKLKFPYDLDGTDEEKCRATYDANVNNGTLVAHLPKVEAGLFFPDLDLTTKLLQMRVSTGASKTMGAMAGASSKADGPPSIQVLSSSATEEEEEDGEDDEKDDVADLDMENLNLEFEEDSDPLYVLCVYIYMCVYMCVYGT